MPISQSDSLEKEPASGKQYPLSHCLGYVQLSKAHKNYSLALSTVYEPRSYAEASRYPDWCKAMDTEYQALVSNNTWTVTRLLAHKKAVACKWVFKVKPRFDGNEERKKACLVAKGFTQRVGLDYEETFSPVANLVMVKTLLPVAAQKQWHLYQLDINSAFLQGELDEEVYMLTPPGYEQQGVHKE